MNCRHSNSWLVLLFCFWIAGCSQPIEKDGESKSLVQKSSNSEETDDVGYESFRTHFQAVSPVAYQSEQAIEAIRQEWHPGSAVMLVEMASFARSSDAMMNIVKLLESKTRQKFGVDFNAWYQWIWNQPYEPHPEYVTFKSELYSKVDPAFSEYFEKTENAKIRLDEIRWGGVKRDGIPPLDKPKMVASDQAGYLADSDVVFGIVLDGDARAYPKRILAWHEMFKDTVGGQSICGVY